MEALGSSREGWSGPIRPTLGSLRFSTFRFVPSVAVRNPVRFSGSGNCSVRRRKKKVRLEITEEGVRVVGNVAIGIESIDTENKDRERERVTVN